MADATAATCRRELDLEIPADEVTKKLESVAKEFARVARVPGFRPGKAPVSLIRRRFADDIKGEVVQSLVPERVEKAVTEQKLTPVSQPQVEKLDFIEGQPLKFRAVFEVLPEFELANYKDLEIGGPQYQALDQQTVQAAYVNTTDGQFTTGNYRLLTDTKKVFGIGNVVPVVTVKALDEEGPVFADTIDKVSALLSLPVIRELNAEVDLSGETPAGVASRFLADHGLIPASSVIPG